MMRVLLEVFSMIVVMEVTTGESEFRSLQLKHSPLRLDDSAIKHLSHLSNKKYTEQVLDNILIPRVVGTQNHRKVYDYIVSELESLNWTIEPDEFEDDTPHGRKTFRNIIAYLNPHAERFLVLACHYDSKFYEDIEFVGATDSAVPCAMLLNLAKTLKNELKSLTSDYPLSLKLVFFDGEEAFEKWGPTDSIYGAKHLADKWERNRFKSKLTNDVVSDLERIDLFILLDLIGHEGTRFLSCFENTKHWYLHMAKLEDKLNNLNLLENKSYDNRYFAKRKYLGYIEDDHIPFVYKKVPVLHLISIPFPKEWHSEHDNRHIIDSKTIEDINKILRIFVVEYLNIKIVNADESPAIPAKEL
ncbi:unnamed protein product [Phyllotreta striolata]|uniref:Glutaminyl-peptide cyclotransferase n=1 Tax=Phyllotreta striolata TaxID=444603 RepID=A0A9N9XRW9_PHYSR|nr:unnamed protein product [Phyllotreta striolata]